MSIISKFSQVDDELLQATLCQHVNRLVGYLERHIPPDLRRLVDPQDVVQDTLFAAYRSANRPALDDSAGMWRWLVTIARHRVVNLIEASQAARRGGGKVFRYDDDSEASVVAMLHELAVYQKTPSKSAARRELVIKLGQSIDRLQEPCRDAIRLRFLDGLSLREIAAQLKRSEDAVQRLVGRGLRLLRIELRSVSLYF